MAEWIGRELERLRKLRGLRREDVAAQLNLSPSTIRNIEHDERYNVSLDLLRQIAEVLGATVKISVEVLETTDEEGNKGAEAVGSNQESGGRRIVSNEYFIRRIRERHPECVLTNSQIGRRMWQFAQSRGAVQVTGRKQLRTQRQRGETPGLTNYRVPTSVAEYAVLERDLIALERFADRLGRAFKDAKGRVLVPIK
jgi:transcriptional regulator with XRE-family HTH domain